MTVLLPEEAEALKFLKQLSLIVIPVPTGRGKTPEFLVDGDVRGYVVEVKTRYDDEEWGRLLDNRKVAYQERSMGYGRWAEDVARAALKQLQAVDPEHTRWWILWLSIKCHASTDAMFEQAIGSLFGVRQVVYYDGTREEQPMRDCVFAKPGVFERHPEIVAAVVTVGDGITLCVNEFAEDYVSFQESILYRSFAQIHPPISATYLAESSGFFQIKDLSINRKDERAIASYLEDNYNLKKPIILDMTAHSASLLVNRGRKRKPPRGRN